jgi:6-phosphogluconate dehydrogenase
MTVGFIGLGKMGSRMSSKLLKEGHEVFAWTRSQDKLQSFQEENPKGKTKNSIEDLIKSLPKPRIVWVMVPSDAVNEVLLEVRRHVEEGDTIIDGGNSFYKETEKRYQEFESSKINFLGIGTSGGVLAVTNGYPFMVGGSKKGYETVIPILDSLSKPNGGHEYFGEGGAGHFVKMVHNGIEYGIMQSLGEGFEVLEKSKYGFDLPKVARLWQKGTLVSGFMLDRASDALSKNPKLDDIVGVIDESGEARWTVEAAKEEGVDVEIIERSLEYRRRSQLDEKIQKSFAGRLVAALRREFGGHKVKVNN